MTDVACPAIREAIEEAHEVVRADEIDEQEEITVFVCGTRPKTDVELLDVLLGRADDLNEKELGDFTNMRAKLDTPGRTLTAKQREMTRVVAERLEIDVDDEDPAIRNQHVPRGKDVETPEVLSQDNLRRALEVRQRARRAGF